VRGDIRDWWRHHTRLLQHGIRHRFSSEQNRSIENTDHCRKTPNVSTNRIGSGSTLPDMVRPKELTEHMNITPKV